MTVTRARRPAGVRAPAVATQQVRYVGRGLSQVAEWDAGNAVRNGHRASWVVARCTEIIAHDIAAAPFLVGTLPGDRTTANPGARLARLLGPPPSGPAPRLTARRLWWWTVAQRVVTGRWAWEVEADDPEGPVSWLWPLASSDVSPIPTDGGVDWFAGFEVGRPDKRRRLRTDQVVYDWQPALDDFRQPFSLLQAARLDVSVQVMLGRYSYSFLRNGATPAIVVVTEEFPDEGSRNRFEQQWTGRYQGPDNAGRVHFHEVGDGDGSVADAIHIERVGISQKDAQMLEQERDALEHVAMALGVPWSRLSASGRTFDNATQEDRTYWMDTVLPLCTDLADAVNIQVAPRCGPEVGWFDLSHVEALRPRPLFTMPDAVAGYAGGVLTANEARDPFGLPPVDGGDELVEPVEPADPSMPAETPAVEGSQDTTLPARSAPTTPTAGSDPDPASGSDGPTPETSPGGGADTRTMRLPGEDGDTRRARLWRTTDATVTTLERRWERAWRRLFRRQADSVARALAGKRGAKLADRVTEWRATPDQVDPASVFNPAYWETESAQLAADLYEQVTTAGFARLSDAFGVAVDIDTTMVQDLIAARANQLAGQVTTTTFEAIRTVMVEGVANGDTLDDIAAGIRHVFEVATDTRAMTIARTEVISAYNGSAVLGATIIGPDVVAGQEWVATRDGRTRPAHAAADGQTIRVGEPFTVHGQSLMYPGDPAGSSDNTINCRCTVAFLTPDEMAARAAAPEPRVPLSAAHAVLHMIRPGADLDVLEMRRALREVAA